MARKEKKYHYIYKITCLKNNRYYIGMHSTDNLDDGYFGGGKRIKNSVKKYGKGIHKKEILEFLKSRDLLKNREKEIVNEDLLNDPMCMNLQIGGGGGFINEQHAKDFLIAGNKEFKERLKNENYKKEFIEKTKKSREKARKRAKELYEAGAFRLDTFKGKKHKEESLEKMRNVDRTGNKNSQFGTFWVCHPQFSTRKIKKDELFFYESQGWKRGRTF